MHRMLVVVGWVVASFAFAPAARAQPVVLVIDDPGAQATIRFPDVAAFEGECTPADPPVGGIPLADTIAYSGGRQIDLLHGVEASDGNIYLAGTGGVLVPADGFCRASARLNEQLYAAQTLPDPRWPWVVLIGAVGFLAILIAYVAAMGRGVGPAPALSRMEADPENEPEAESSDATAASD